MRHQVWEYFEMRLGFLLAIFNILQEWNGFNVDDKQVTHLSMADLLCNQPAPEVIRKYSQ
jgi:hypothetical protein